MASDNKYSISLIWSSEDGHYLAQVKELPGCIADGDTAEEAVRNITVIAQEWIETAREEGREIPQPKTLEILERDAEAAHEQFAKQIQQQIQSAVQGALDNLTEQQHRQTSNISVGREGVFSGFEAGTKQKVG